MKIFLSFVSPAGNRFFTKNSKFRRVAADKGAKITITARGRLLIRRIHQNFFERSGRFEVEIAARIAVSLDGFNLRYSEFDKNVFDNKLMLKTIVDESDVSAQLAGLLKVLFAAPRAY